MSETVRIGDTGAKAKIRHPLLAFALVFLTLGIYYLVWYYKVNRELRDLGRATGNEERLGRHPFTSLAAITLGWLLLVPPFVSFYRTMQRIEAAQELRWTRQRVSPTLAFVLYVIGLFALPFEVIYAQSEMNRVWREEPGRTPSVIAPAAWT
jgi:Ca2+/Na+ antiporter